MLLPMIVSALGKLSKEEEREGVMLEELMINAEDKAQVRGKEKRRSPRVVLKVPVVVYSKDSASVASLYFTKDVSRDGIFMEGPKKTFLVGEKVYMEFQVPLQVVSRRIRLIGRVVRIVEDSKSGYGIEFERMFDQDYHFLSCYLPSLRVRN